MTIEFGLCAKELSEQLKDYNLPKEKTGKAYYDLACEVEDLRAGNERLRADNLYGLSASSLAKKVEELSHENERLRNRVVCKVVIPDEKLEEIKNECLERVELDIKAIQAGTVRKMQNELKKTFSAICKGEMGDLYRITDQIAKEIMEENK